MELKDLDIKGKVLWIKGGEFSRTALESMRKSVKEKGGLGVIWSGDETEISTQSIDQAIANLQAIKERNS